MKTLTSTELTHLLVQEPHVLVKFFSVTCTPCKMITPVLEELEKEFEGKLQFVNYDVATDEYELANTLKLRAVPTIAIFHHGKSTHRLVGISTKQQIKEWIEEVLEKPTSQENPL